MSAATSLTSAAERAPSGSGSSSTLTESDIFLNQTDALAPSLTSVGKYRVFLALCLRLVVAITNFERGDDPGREKLKL